MSNKEAVPQEILFIPDAENQLEKLGKQYPKVFFIAVPKEHEDQTKPRDEQECDIVFVRYPDNHVLRIITPMVAQNKLFDVAEIVLENCIVEGDKELAKDGQFVFGAMPAVEQIIGGRMGHLGKRLPPGGRR